MLKIGLSLPNCSNAKIKLFGHQVAQSNLKVQKFTCQIFKCTLLVHGVYKLSQVVMWQK